MTMNSGCKQDVEVILSHRYDNGGDLFATPDKRLLKGLPFSTLDCAMYLSELGMPFNDPVMEALSDLIFSVKQEDGRFKIAPTGSIYPCQTAIAANALCHMGYAEDSRLNRTFQYLLEIQSADGGLRCRKFSFGHGPETEYSNPQPTLNALDAFRYSPYLNKEPALDKAVDFLLEHWVIKKPIGPCHYGIGTLFMQVEYPFRSYNLFAYVYVLSFYDYAKRDSRFLSAFEALRSKTDGGRIIVERNVPKLSQLNFCKKGVPSDLATKHYHEILKNLNMESI